MRFIEGRGGYYSLPPYPDYAQIFRKRYLQFLKIHAKISSAIIKIEFVKNIFSNVNLEKNVNTRMCILSFLILERIS